jgi:four helix bundle protein
VTKVKENKELPRELGEGTCNPARGKAERVPKVKDNREFSKELEKRTRKFAVRIIRLSASLPDTPEGRAIRTQLTKAGTSIGANYREANRARSRADFRSKIKICQSEASETQYWLEVIVDIEWLPWLRLKPDYDECSELLAIFSSIGKGT